MIVAAFGGNGGRGEPPSLEAPAPAPLPDLGGVPDFSFTERSGRTVARKDLLGKVWVADFIFTNCGGVCPAMSLRLGEVHAALRKEPDALCVTWTTDPERDSLEVLREYAGRWNASEDRWLFLRGEQAAVLSLQFHGFKLGSLTEPFQHSERFVLVDARGRIRGYYHATEDGAVEAILRDFRRLRSGEGS